MPASKSRRSVKPGGPSGIERDGPRILSDLRASLAAVVASVPGAGGRPVDLAETFGIDRKLAWKISNVISGSGPDPITRYVPGPSGITLFLEAAARLGVKRAARARVEDAASQFRALIREHAGDRGSLDVLLTGLGDDAATGPVEIDLATRRAAFRCASAIWGARARLQFRTEIFRISRHDPARFDSATIRGMVGLQHMRAGHPWTLFRGGWVDDDGSPRPASSAGPAQRRPVDPEPFRRTGVPLLPEFCSPKHPPISRVPAAGSKGAGLADDVLEPGPVGSAGEVTVVTADTLARIAPRFHTPKDPLGHVPTMASTPSQLLVSDIIVERGALDLHQATAAVLGDLNGLNAAPGLIPRLPCPLEMRVLTAPGRSEWSLREFACYSAVVDRVLRALGWADAEYDVLRVRVEFPILPSALLISLPLPKQR